jgi:hypothetical protein
MTAQSDRAAVYLAAEHRPRGFGRALFSAGFTLPCWASECVRRCRCEALPADAGAAVVPVLEGRCASS